MRYFSLCALFSLVSSLPLAAADFELNRDSLAELSREVQGVFAKHSGYRFKKAPAIVLSSPKEIAAVLQVELFAQFKSLPQYDEAAARRMASRQGSLLAQGLIAKYAVEKHQVMVNKKGIKKASQLLSLPALRNRDVLAAILIHELVHAMDHERTGVFEHLKTAKTTDGLWALNCLIEGHAQFVARGICAKEGWLKPFGVFTKSIGTIPENKGQDEATRLLTRVLIDRIASAYYDGERFIAALHASGGDRLVARAFANPPQTSSVIVKPEWYLNPELRSEAVDFDAILDEFESFSAGKKSVQRQGPWPSRKTTGVSQRVSIAKSQLAGIFEPLGKQESVDQLIREMGRARGIVLNDRGAITSAVLYEFESPDASARFLVLADQLQRLKDEKMKSGLIQITSAVYDKISGKGWRGTLAAKSLKAGFRNVKIKNAVVACGKYAVELLYSNNSVEDKRIVEALDLMVGLILKDKPGKEKKSAVAAGKKPSAGEAGVKGESGPGWVFSKGRKLKYEIEYLNSYRFNSDDKTDKEDKSEREMRDEAAATVIFSAGDSGGSATELSIEFTHLGLKSGSDDNPGYARYDSGVADADLGKSRKIRWCKALKDGNPAISIAPGGRITGVKGFDGTQPQHGKLGMVLFGNHFLRAPELPQKPASGKSWKGFLTLMHCVDSPLQRYGWDAFEVEVPMVFTIRKISGGEYSVEGVVEPETTLSMGDPRNEGFIPASTPAGTWKGKWSTDHWQSTSWDVTAAFALGGISGTLNSRYSATLKK